MSRERGLEDYIRKEFPGLYGLLYGNKRLNKSIQPVITSTSLEKAMAEVEAKRNAELMDKMQETYRKWYGNFSLVKFNFRDLGDTVGSFVEKVSNWARFPDRVSAQTCSGLGYTFDVGVKAFRRGIRISFPWGGYGGLGDERLMGGILLKNGPTENPYALFNNTGITPNLREMAGGANRLLERFDEARLSITAHSPGGNFNGEFSSDQLMDALNRGLSLTEMFENLMVAINEDDFRRYSSGYSENPLLLLQPPE